MGTRVLSIQSHVAYGYVGGKAAVFPLQCLGFDVDVVNTVNFSNHSGYGRFGGSTAAAQDLEKIFNAMEENGLMTQDRLLTGYIPGAEALSVVSQLARKLKARNPDIIYLLDPVMGDSGELYVASDVIPVYRSMLPYATIITPNWFEVETLTTIRLTDFASLRKALATLHEDYSVPNVVISSIPLRSLLAASLPFHISKGVKVEASGGSERSPGYLLCICSSRTSEEERRHNPKRLSCVYAHIVPCIPGYVSGVGDLFSALTLAHYSPSSSTPAASSSLAGSNQHLINDKHKSLSIAVSYAISKTLAILRLTHAHISAATSESPPSGPFSGSSHGSVSKEDGTDEEKDTKDPERRVRRMRARELRLVQGQDILRSTLKLSSTSALASEGTTAPRSAIAPETGFKGQESVDARAALSKGERDAGAALELREMLPWNEFWTS